MSLGRAARFLSGQAGELVAWRRIARKFRKTGAWPWQDLTLLGSPAYCVRASLNYVCKGYTKNQMVLVFRPLHRLLGRVDHFWKNRFE